MEDGDAAIRTASGRVLKTIRPVRSLTNRLLCAQCKSAQHFPRAISETPLPMDPERRTRWVGRGREGRIRVSNQKRRKSKSTGIGTFPVTVQVLMISRRLAVIVVGAVLALTGLVGPSSASSSLTVLADDHLLSPGEVLELGQSVTSSSGRVTLSLRHGGDLVLYQDNRAMWATGTAGTGAHRLIMRHDGVLALYRHAAYGSAPVWQSPGRAVPGATLSVQDEGGMVMRTEGSPIIWSAALSAPDVGLEGVRHVIYGRGDQMVWLVESDGSLFDSYPVSGRATWPVPGRYKVLSKSLRSSSVSGHVSMEHMVRFVQPPGLAATGFHSIPVTWAGTPIQTEAELGQFRSAGCVRQANDKAEQMYAWAPLGTPVIVLA